MATIGGKYNKGKCADILHTISKQGEIVPSTLLAIHGDSPTKKHD